MGRSVVAYRGGMEDNARWDEVVLRPDDIVISTPAKCGTTWLQMICALLVFGTSKLPDRLDDLSPFIDLQIWNRAEMASAVEAQRHRRFLKTHTPLDGLPFDERVTYLTIGRDPRDVALSNANHNDNKDPEALRALLEAAGEIDLARSFAESLDPIAGADQDGPDGPDEPKTVHDRFWRWMEQPRQSLDGLEALLHHLQTFWWMRGRSNVVVLHYDDLRADLEGQMRALADRLGIEIPDERWPELVWAATFDRMRDRAVELAPAPGMWRDHTRFFNRGTSGQWRDVLDDADLARYRALVDVAVTEQGVDPELVTWLHRGAPLT